MNGGGSLTAPQRTNSLPGMARAKSQGNGLSKASLTRAASTEELGTAAQVGWRLRTAVGSSEQSHGRTYTQICHAVAPSPCGANLDPGGVCCPLQVDRGHWSGGVHSRCGTRADGS